MEPAIDGEAFAQRHRRRFGKEPRLFAAPGRVNLIGEHTDYNEGFVLPMAIDRYTVVGMNPIDGPVLRVYSEALDETAEIDLRAPFQRCGAWSDYVAGVAAVVSAQSPLGGGACLSISGDLPIGAGLSSSAALELSVGLALYALTGATVDARRLATAGASAEHDYVGIRSGVMDQLICALGVSGNALLIDCRSLETTPIPLPPNVTIAVCDTGVKHALASSEYNDRRAACERGVEILRQRGMNITALRDLSVDEFERVQQLLPSPIRERCRHVVFENQRTLDAARAIAAGNLQKAGELFNASHRSLKELYEVSSPELDRIVEVAQNVPGVYGARMTGGGFGGAAIAMLRPDAFGELCSRLDELYYRMQNMLAAVFAVRAVDGASEIHAAGPPTRRAGE